MTPEATVTTAAALQKGLLVGYTILLLIAAMAGARVRRLRPLAFSVGFLSATHAVYYALFLVWPEALGPQGTMLFSIGLRWLVLFVAVFMLAMALKREQWPT